MSLSITKCIHLCRNDNYNIIILSNQTRIVYSLRKGEISKKNFVVVALNNVRRLMLSKLNYVLSIYGKTAKNHIKKHFIRISLGSYRLNVTKQNNAKFQRLTLIKIISEAKNKHSHKTISPFHL